MNAASFSAIWDADARSLIEHDGSASVGDMSDNGAIDCESESKTPVLSRAAREAAVRLATHARDAAESRWQRTGSYIDAAKRDMAQRALDQLAKQEQA